MPGRSAHSLAHHWFNANDLPPRVRSVIESEPLFEGAQLLDGFFERRVDLRDGHLPSQTDLMVVLRLKEKLAIAAVEGKTEESFGPSVERWLEDARALPKTGKPERLASLCETLGLDAEAIGHVRFHLLYRAASAIREAERYAASAALLLIHSFSDSGAGFEDYAEFLYALGQKDVAADKMHGPVNCGAVSFHTAWVSDRPFSP